MDEPGIEDKHVYLYDCVLTHETGTHKKLYIYIYVCVCMCVCSHPQTGCFLESQLFIVVGHARFLNLDSKTD